MFTGISEADYNKQVADEITEREGDGETERKGKNRIIDEQEDIQVLGRKKSNDRSKMRRKIRGEKLSFLCCEGLENYHQIH